MIRLLALNRFSFVHCVSSFFAKRYFMMENCLLCLFFAPAIDCYYNLVKARLVHLLSFLANMMVTQPQFCFYFLRFFQFDLFQFLTLIFILQSQKNRKQLLAVSLIFDKYYPQNILPLDEFFLLSLSLI